MIHIHFIVNPISGKGKHQIDQKFLESHFSTESYVLKVSYSTYKKQAITLTQEALEANPDIIVACGGDGTIHEVATALVGKDVAFGVLPVGSGNGLASNLNLPKDLNQALEVIKKGHVNPMDVGSINGHYFFSNMGFGIDATVIELYEKSGKRKLGAYVKSALNAAKEYRAKPIQIRYGTTTKQVNPLLLFISNSNEMGYQMSLTPKASIRDGLLDMLIVPKISLLKQLYYGLLVAIKKTHWFKNALYEQVDFLEVQILEAGSNTLQLDGEYYHFETDHFKIGIYPKALKVIC